MTDYFPCPRKHFQYGVSPSQEALIDFGIPNMLIYGHNPTPPPPATLTQEQLARDAGQLVEAHVLLDKLCDDTDRSQHSLVHRIKQIVYGSEEMSKVLEKAGFNTAAGLLECVRALAQRQKTTKETLDQVEARALGYQLEITRLKDRNKRLHDAQGSGTAEAAKLQNVRKQVLAWFPGGSAEAQAKFSGHTLAQLISELVTTLGDGSKIEMLERMHMHNTMLYQFHGLTYNQAKEKHAGYSTQSLLDAILENHRVRLTKAESEAGRDPALDRMVQEAHRLMHKAGVSPLSGTIVERVGNLVDECARLKIGAYPRVQAAHLKLNTVEQISTFGTIDERVASLVDLFKARVASVPLYAIPSVKLVDECVRLLDKAGIPNGTLDERVRVAIERGQQAKLAPDAAHCVKIVEECTRKLTQADVPTGNLLDRIQMLINDRAALLNSKTSYGVSPTLDEKAWEVRNRDNRVMAVCTSLADAQRIRASLEAR